MRSNAASGLPALNPSGSPRRGGVRCVASRSPTYRGRRLAPRLAADPSARASRGRPVLSGALHSAVMPKLESKSSRKKNAAKTNPVTVICRFAVKPDREKEFMKLLSRDWPNLLRLGLATKDEPTVYRHVDETGGPVYFQIMSWASEQAVGSA